MRILASALLIAVCAAGPSLSSGSLSAQAYVPASSPHPVIVLDSYVRYPALLLTLPRGFDLLGTSPDEGQTQMTAHREFERALRSRTAGIVGEPAGREAHNASKRRLLEQLGHRLAGLPGAALIAHGKAVWEQVERTTDFDVQGYRVRLRMDEAVEGKLALKVQKQLR